jgi:hypothetical protein
LPATQLIKIVEKVLPRKYGGHSTDFQIIENEDKKSLTRLIIMASPSLGEISATDLIETVLYKLKAEDKRSIIPDFFAQAETFQVKRDYPISTERGKILPLHVRRKR